ncbi:MAG: glutamine--tRNA ligase/YqeY domain fusion protein [Nitrospirae bacterium]|nr:glutamine--tRNA ligase/YqeY domain fusion protein [Nitrospirota bacterium]
MTDETPRQSDFIRESIAVDQESGIYGKRVHTRFPPEPNGYLHLGHAKSICLNFGIARDFGGRCNLRFDDTNPEKEEQEYVDSIIDSVRWLGFDFGPAPLYASDYFDFMYKAAEYLITAGHAYVDSQSADEMRENRGTLTSPGKNSPFRERSAEENLRLFREMRDGRHPDGSMVLRAKIDMASGNINLRDPAIYRIKHADHHRTGSTWCIYPMYTYAHPVEDAIEQITHSICTLEFEDQRPFYDWLLERLAEGGLFKRPLPRQIEFARLNLSHTILSKRKLIQLVQDGHVSGWDDPRMPTISGIRRRGYTPEAIKNFCERIGVAKRDSTVGLGLLEYCIREDLNRRAPRVMSVLRPLKVVITNYPEAEDEELDAINNPEDPSAGTRKVPFCRELYIEQEDFREDPPKQFFRLAPGREVRLRYAYFITCEKVIKDEKTGEVRELLCSYDPKTRGGDAPDGRKVKATLHWVSARHSQRAEVRLYDTLFTETNPGDRTGDFRDDINPKSLEVIKDCRIEPGLSAAAPSSRFQFERMGYFCVDADSTPEKPVFNRVVILKDTWAKVEKAQKK